MDEVFAAGDEALKKKCRHKVSQSKTWGKTIVFLSHALNTVKALRQGALRIASR
jgi:lipopolysaccharide transport system ATP-binding protein